MQDDIQKILIPRQDIARRVAEMAERITRDLSAEPHGDRITLVPILTGSIIFVSDLIRLLPLRLSIELISVSSYRGPSTEGGTMKIRDQLTSLGSDLRGVHVLIIDDILDSGRTLALVRGLLAETRPATLRTCVLLRKQRPEAMSVNVDYVCFDVPDEFVVGYGLDYDNHYRNLPDIVTLRPEALGARDAAPPPTP